MAVIKVPQSARMVVKVQTGVNSLGKPVTRLRSFKNVKPDATDADIFAVGQGLSDLQQYPVISIAREDDSDLIEQ
jgi:hypothetical protein